MDTLIGQISEFAEAFRQKEMPERLMRISADLFTDSMGCMMAGLHEESTGRLLTYLRNKKKTDEIRDFRNELDAEEKALLYGFISHNFDFDNSSNIIGHNSAVLFPALFSMCDENPISGEAFLKAYVFGTEVSFAIAKKMIPGMNFRGFHITPVFGVIGAAAACAFVSGMRGEAFANAISIAISHCSGLMAQFGSDMKFYHCGMGASAAVRAVLLAQAGVIGKQDVLESKSGFFHAYYQMPEDINLYLGEQWNMLEESFLIKAYPCCSASHSAIYGMQQFLEETGISPEQILSIKVFVPEYTPHNLIYREPSNATEAKFSMYFAIANILKNREYDLRSFGPENLSSPELKKHMMKVEMTVSEEFPAFVEAEPCRLEIVCENGEYERKIPFGLGRTLDSPLDKEQLKKKFVMCAERHSANAEACFEELYDIRRVEEVHWDLQKGTIK